MHSLSELKELLLKEGVQIKEFGGWYLKVHKDTWTLLNGKFYKNNEPQNLKQKGLFDKYKRKVENVEDHVVDRRSSIKKIMSARIS